MRSISRQGGLARAGYALPAGIAIAGILLSAVPSGAAAATVARSAFRRVTYLGHSFEVPRTWQVIGLSRHRRTCVRFDRHAVYLGTPSRNQACPSSVVGTTEAMLIGPASRNAVHVSVENKVTRQITVVTGRLTVTATFGTHPAEIDRILASAGLRRPVVRTAVSDLGGIAGGTRAAGVPSLPAAVTDFQGRGFDTCAAPSEAAMGTWRSSSPYGAVGIYLGGSDRACAQPNLTPSWLRHEAAAGWHFFPMYVGPQAVFGELSKSSASQGAAAAADAVHQAKRLGFGRRTPIYYDMEAYLPGQGGRVLRFFSAWATTLHALGYSSGVYSSSSSGIADLAHQFGLGRYAMPDVIFDALWNGQANTQDPVFGPGEWADHHRLHQYRGNVTRSYGGTTMDVDLDFLNVRLSPSPSPSPSASGSPSSSASPSPSVTQPSETPSPLPSPSITQPVPVTQPNGTPSPSAAFTLPDGTTDVFYRGTDGGLWYVRHVPGGGWARPVGLGGHLASEPSAIAVDSEHIRVFYRGADGFLWQVRYTPAGWSRPRALSRMGVLGGRPMAVAQPTGVIDVFWKSPGAHLSFGEYSQAQGWSSPQRLAGKLASYPSPVISSRGVIQVFWKGQGGRPLACGPRPQRPVERTREPGHGPARKPAASNRPAERQGRGVLAASRQDSHSDRLPQRDRSLAGALLTRRRHAPVAADSGVRRRACPRLFSGDDGWPLAAGGNPIRRPGWSAAAGGETPGIGTLRRHRLRRGPDRRVLERIWRPALVAADVTREPRA